MRFRAEQHLRRPADIRPCANWDGESTAGHSRCGGKTRSRGGHGRFPSDPPRVCVIASSQGRGFGVERNRARRRLREVFRHQQQLVPADCDLLLIARDTAKSWPLASWKRLR
jgi:ribonuclease P protein component